MAQEVALNAQGFFHRAVGRGCQLQEHDSIGLVAPSIREQVEVEDLVLGPWRFGASFAWLLRLQPQAVDLAAAIQRDCLGG
jgi:hypothetical protein